jgi:hypothetical protein
MTTTNKKIKTVQTIQTHGITVRDVDVESLKNICKFSSRWIQEVEKRKILYGSSKSLHFWLGIPSKSELDNIKKLINEILNI